MSKKCHFPVKELFALRFDMILCNSFDRFEWMLENQWVWLSLWYTFFGLLTMIIYWVDKYAAKHDFERVPERTLHILELIGGWPGALLAQRLFHHKCSKVSYQHSFQIIIPLNVLGAFYFAYGSITGDWKMERLFMCSARDVVIGFGCGFSLLAVLLILFMFLRCLSSRQRRSHRYRLRLAAHVQLPNSR